MPSDVLTCPYCNAAATPPPGARPGQRVPCPRCGESFPYHGTVVQPGVPAAPPQAPPEPPSPAPRRLSNAQIAVLILGGMVLMAVLGLVYALSTQGIRREYDFHLPKTRGITIPLYAVIPLALYVVGLLAAWVWGWNRRDSAARSAPPARRVWGLVGLSALVLAVAELAIVYYHSRAQRPSETEVPAPVKAVPPIELAALRYLPADSDFLIIVPVAALLDGPLGRDLMSHLGNDAFNPASLEAWSGLKLDDMDHAVLALSLDENLLTNFTVVVRSRPPIDQDRVLKALKAENGRDLDGRLVHPFLLRNVPFFHELQANAWFADANTLVVAKRFNDGPRHVIPLTPPAEPQQLQPELRRLIADRMDTTTRAGAAGHLPPSDNLSPLVRALFLLRENAPLKKLRTFGVWITTDAEAVTLHGAFDCADEEGAKDLTAYLAPANRQGVKEWLTTPEAGPMERAFADSMEISQDGTWVKLTAKAGAAAIRREK